MDSKETDILRREPKTYQEWIDQGNNQLRQDIKEAQISYEKALNLVEDKYEAYVLLGKSYHQYSLTALKYFFFALEYAGNKKDRLLLIATELEKLKYKNISLYLHGLIKQIDPDYDHEIPKNLNDYSQIVHEYLANKKAQYASAPIEKLIELSENKPEILMQIGKVLLEDGHHQLAQQYFERALNLQEDKYNLLLKMGDIYVDNYCDQAAKFYDMAKILQPESFMPQLGIIKLKLKLELFQEALEYIKIVQIPEQSYIDLGLLLIIKKQLYNEGVQYIFKGIEISQDKIKTLTQSINLDQLQGAKLKIQLCEKALEIKSDDYILWETYVQHLIYFEDKSQETINIIDRALSFHPNYDKFYLHKANVLVELGRNDEAIAVLKYGIELCPKYTYKQTLGQLLLEVKQLDEGLKQFYLAIDQQEDYALDYLKSYLFEYKYYEECIKACDRYEQQYPNQLNNFELKAMSFFE